MTLNAQPFGSWSSPISIAMLSSGGIRFNELVVHESHVLWTESRPEQKGRSTLLTWREGKVVELTPEPFNVRSRVHEYGGGAFTTDGDTVIFSNLMDNRLYRTSLTGGESTPITPESSWRFADLKLAGNRLFAVREDHSITDSDPANTIVVLDPEGPNTQGGSILVSGSDFVSSLICENDRVAWLQWDHPNMPWDGCDLYTASLTEDLQLQQVRHIAGGAEEAVQQPEFLPDGRIGFVSDRSGWWNCYAASTNGEITPLLPDDAEYGFAMWQFGRNWWGVLNDSTLLVTRSRDGFDTLGRLDLGTGEVSWIDQPFSTVNTIHPVRGTQEAVGLLASPSQATSLVRVNLNTGEYTELRAPEQVVDPVEFSHAEAISWKTSDGTTAHGFYYPPVNSKFTGEEGELPPLIVESHGGPTAISTPDFSLSKQFWTNRGFAILDVNYGGSTGYGREYRTRLNGNWGLVDVDDCITGVDHLVAQQRVDPTRIIIRGGSAGGFTTLAALTTSSVFQIGTSYFGIGDLEALATETHKFESRYMDSMVGPYPETRETYEQRSPVHHTDRLQAAMLLLQGLEDKVVPPNQAQDMAAAVREKALPVAHIEFEGEGHGFRGSYAQRRSIEAELSFYSQIFGFPLADTIEPVQIENFG